MPSTALLVVVVAIVVVVRLMMHPRYLRILERFQTPAIATSVRPSVLYKVYGHDRRTLLLLLHRLILYELLKVYRNGQGAHIEEGLEGVER